MDNSPLYLNAVASVLKMGGDGFYIFVDDGRRLPGNWTAETSILDLWKNRGEFVGGNYRKQLECAVRKYINRAEPEKVEHPSDLPDLVGRFLNGGGPRGICYTFDFAEAGPARGETESQYKRRFYRLVWDTRGTRPYGVELDFWVREQQAAQKTKKVEHPAHYGGEGTYETINVINALGWGREFCLGNALKYLMRAGKKAGESEADDLKKAVRYIQMHLAELEKGDATP